MTGDRQHLAEYCLNFMTFSLQTVLVVKPTVGRCLRCRPLTAPHLSITVERNNHSQDVLVISAFINGYEAVYIEYASDVSMTFRMFVCFTMQH